MFSVSLYLIKIRTRLNFLHQNVSKSECEYKNELIYIKYFKAYMCFLFGEDEAGMNRQT